MEKKTIELYRKKFDDIRHESDGIEYWYARELMKLLDYVQWRNLVYDIKPLKDHSNPKMTAA